MQVRQWIIAGVRTGVQRLIAIALGALAAWASTKGWFFEIDVTSIGARGLIDVVVTAAVTAGLVRLEKSAPWLTPYLSLGMTRSTPEYEGPPPALMVAKP